MLKIKFIAAFSIKKSNDEQFREDKTLCPQYFAENNVFFPIYIHRWYTAMHCLPELVYQSGNRIHCQRPLLSMVAGSPLKVTYRKLQF